MGGGGHVVPTGGKQYEGRMTAFVMMTCVVAGTGGLIFGYDIGISGGVTSSDDFLKKFFPSVLHAEKAATGNNQYCKFDSELLTLFTSSLYVAALIASFCASSVTKMLGRRVSMLIGGVTFMAGALFNGLAQSVWMLIVGRLLLGVGIGFGNQSVPVYLSEMAPAKYRGALNIGFQLFVTLGIFAANMINYMALPYGESGWRFSLGFAGAPGAIITVGALVLPDTPNYLISRGDPERAKAMLKKIRGIDSVDEEYNDLVEAFEASKKVTHPWKNIMERQNRPQLTFALLIPFFQQLTGINVIMFYAPVIFKTLGFGSNASLMSSVITGVVNVLATCVSIVCVDRLGRRKLFLLGGVQMLITQIAIGVILGKVFGVSGTGSLSKGASALVVFSVCMYVAAFAWSWGPLGWLVPSEIFPLETRSAGMAINVSVNMFFTFIIAQSFLKMLCAMKFGLFFFFGGFVVIMSFFVYFFLPETRNVPIEEMYGVWRQHWLWRTFIPDQVAAGVEIQAAPKTDV